MMVALLLLPIAYAMARGLDIYAAYRRRTDPWSAQA
ncbi:hypothetical protein AXYL_02042 [Achromobacter xylosoxidans A8]|uniref:Uncharacterized protein n=1 Tax=Achromobacter xylosoxidans (strain A8) TaxID=762376 RepID=E3HGN5_ACHXA|nr:hypothetical protein AXYL_02042 [Achromobacter xylosoxidans A8]